MFFFRRNGRELVFQFLEKYIELQRKRCFNNVNYFL